jgi:hypothetical protein
MKEYGCCPKFKRGDNSTYTFTKRGGGGVALTRYMDGRTDRRTDRVIPIYPPTPKKKHFVCGGYKEEFRKKNYYSLN